MRIPCQPLKPVNLAVNCLFFNDGSQKTLAAFIAWVSLCIASELPGTDMADFTHPSVLSLVGSLLRMDTVLKASVSQGDEIDSAISRIVKQNVDSKVLPISALTWASVLASLGDGISLDQAVSGTMPTQKFKLLKCLALALVGSLWTAESDRWMGGSVFRYGGLCFKIVGLPSSSCHFKVSF